MNLLRRARMILEPASIDGQSPFRTLTLIACVGLLISYGSYAYCAMPDPAVASIQDHDHQSDHDVDVQQHKLHSNHDGNIEVVVVQEGDSHDGNVAVDLHDHLAKLRHELNQIRSERNPPTGDRLRFKVEEERNADPKERIEFRHRDDDTSHKAKNEAQWEFRVGQKNKRDSKGDRAQNKFWIESNTRKASEGDGPVIYRLRKEDPSSDNNQAKKLLWVEEKDVRKSDNKKKVEFLKRESTIVTAPLFTSS